LQLSSLTKTRLILKLPVPTRVVAIVSGAVVITDSNHTDSASIGDATWLDTP
jgi:hypothetical protein